MKHLLRPALVLASCLWVAASHAAANLNVFEVGVGKSDITGEAAEVGMMGYADGDQVTAGIHMRQWARAFAIRDVVTQKRLVYVNTELAMMFQSVHQAVLKQLTAKFGDRYTRENVILTATHTHSGPGGFSHYFLYNATSKGFNKETFNAIVDGIVEAIVAADADLKPGYIRYSTGKLFNANVQRSLPAFMKNPAPQRNKFTVVTEDGGRKTLNNDPHMAVMTFSQGNIALGTVADVGMIAWFPTHGTSLHHENQMISGDNKGFAAWLVETRKKQQTGKNFIAAFPQSNPGDMSPNLNLDGTGPTNSQLENEKEIGTRQADKAMEVSNTNVTSYITGTLDFRQQYVDMSKVEVRSEFKEGYLGGSAPGGSPVSTCVAALGKAFAAGTEDYRPSMPIPLVEGDLSTNDIKDIRVALNWLIDDNKDVTGDFPSVNACQAPKPVLIVTGAPTIPWTPEVMPVTVAKIGNVALVTGPGEFTIMAGLNSREVVANRLGVSVDRVIFSGYANAYSGYVTTPQEYDAQHYEGGSTHFGRYTLPAYLQIYNDLSQAIVDKKVVAAGPTPRDLSNDQISLQLGVVLDNTPIGVGFGDLEYGPPHDHAFSAGDWVQIGFWTGHPKNSVHLLRNKTFLQVDKWNSDAGVWKPVAGLNDNHPDTNYSWTREDGLWGTSLAHIKWHIAPGTEPGSYRIRHFGHYKDGWTGNLYPVTGTSDTFLVK